MPVNARDSTGTSRDKQGQGRDKQGQGRDKQGQAGTSRDIPFLSLLVPTCLCLSLSVHACPCLSLSVPVCPCLSLSVPFCPCLSLSVPVCLYICYTIMSTPADEYNSLHQYEQSYIDFQKPLLQCMQTLFLNSSFIQSKQFYSSDKYHKRAPPGFL